MSYFPPSVFPRFWDAGQVIFVNNSIASGDDVVSEEEVVQNSSDSPDDPPYQCTIFNKCTCRSEPCCVYFK